jgi:transcriptional regulator with XRE-family HTH domain
VRTREDVSPSDVAAALKVAPATVYRWESDEKSPGEENLARLAAFLGVTPAYLRYGVKPTDDEQRVLEHEAEQQRLRALIHPSEKTLTDAEDLARQSEARDDADDDALREEKRKKKAAGRRR